ncbi:ankyrin repeat family A protein 2-like [Ylistrum balloti]|uniref:ankyrin repeat family A protein 2-like n=1 Tax=Ylistrum balloti TaxID=509963 RepID=UPI0029059505|nr:ankyrin repeat family A protein 2-like [Ylistrum balloti]
MEVTDSSCGKKNSKGGDDTKKGSPDRLAGGRRKLLSPMRRFASSGHAGAFRLVSPIDSDQELNDLEVASVLAEGNKESSDCVSPTKSKRHETPFRPTTVMTNLQRGNVQTTTPLILKNLTIHQLAAQGELVLLQQEISEGTDINKPDAAGMTALLWASANGQQATTEFLVDKNADINVCGKHGENALLLACSGGYTDIVYYLLSLGLDVNYSDESGSTGLMYACYRNHTGCIQALLEYGADITHTNEDQLTAMDLAVGQGHKAAQQTIEQHILSLFGSSAHYIPEKL